jgi:hypothetical protein
MLHRVLIGLLVCNESGISRGVQTPDVSDASYAVAFPDVGRWSVWIVELVIAQPHTLPP